MLVQCDQKENENVRNLRISKDEGDESESNGMEIYMRLQSNRVDTTKPKRGFSPPLKVNHPKFEPEKSASPEKLTEKDDPLTAKKQAKVNISLSHYKSIEFLETQKTFTGIDHNLNDSHGANIDETVVTIHPSHDPRV